MRTIYQAIREAVEAAKIPGIRYEEGYPRDHVRLVSDPVEDEEMDTMKPLLEAMKVITAAIENEADQEDDIEVTFYHLPGEEEWGIAIGDGR